MAQRAFAANGHNLVIKGYFLSRDTPCLSETRQRAQSRLERLVIWRFSPKNIHEDQLRRSPETFPLCPRREPVDNYATSSPPASSRFSKLLEFSPNGANFKQFYALALHAKTDVQLGPDVWRRSSLLDIGVHNFFYPPSLEFTKCHKSAPYNAHAQRRAQYRF